MHTCDECAAHFQCLGAFNDALCKCEHQQLGEDHNETRKLFLYCSHACLEAAAGDADDNFCW